MRVAFLHPLKLSDHFFVEAHEVAIASALTAEGHPAELVDYLFDPDRDEAEQIEELRQRLVAAAYDVIFLRLSWSDALGRAVASATRHLVGWESRDLLEQGIAAVAVTHVSREVVQGLVAALAADADLSEVPGLSLRRGDAVTQTPPAKERSIYEELSTAPYDAGRRVTLSKKRANETRAVVVSNFGCAYRNVPNRSEVFEGVELPKGVSTAGCTFCGVRAYEKMTEEQAITLVIKQIDAELRARPEVKEIAIKDDFSLRFLGKLGARLLAWSEQSGISLSHRTVLLSARPDYLLTYREAIESALAGAFPAALGFYLLGYENFSDAELHRYHKGMSGAEIERALELMDAWAAAYPQRFRISPTSGFILFGPWTTLEDLRINANVMRRRGFSRFRGRALLSQLRLHPEQPLYWLAKKDGLLVEDRQDPRESDAYRRGYRVDAPFRFADPKVAAVHAAVLRSAHLPDDALFDVFEDALDDAAGQPRGKNKRPHRMVRSPNEQKHKGARTQQVSVGQTCNQNCAFCTYRAQSEREPLKERAERAANDVRRAASAGATTLVLTGAEPTLQPYLFDLAKLATNLGVTRVELETNGTLLGAAFLAGRGASVLEAMKAGGIASVRLALNALSAETSDAITRDPGGFARTEAALSALLRGGLAVELAVALVPANQGELRKIVERASALKKDLDLAGDRISVSVRWIHSARPGFVTLPIEVARRELLSGYEAARAHAIPLRVAAGAELPPCVYPEPAAVADLFRLHAELVTREESLPEAERRYVRLPACASCAAADVCPGPLRGCASRVAPLARSLAPSELSEKTTRSNVRERQLREYKSELSAGRGEEAAHQRRILRLVFHCNQACDFCFVSRELPPIEHERLVAEIEECGEKGIAIDFSGGEPTLHPDVLSYIELALEKGVPRVELQTNAIKMADPTFARALARSGLHSAFVSLHGTSARVSDRVTAAPGTFDKTLRGIENLLAEGLPVQLNFVVCGANVSELAGYPDFVHQRFLAPRLARGEAIPEVGITLSYAAASTDNVPRDVRLIPRISSVAAQFEAAIDRARALGIPVSGLDTKCGVPACYLPRSVREVAFAYAVPKEEQERASFGFTKAAACARCDYQDRCYGIRTSYAEIHGTGELRAIRDGQIVPEVVDTEAGPADHPAADDPYRRIGLSTTHRLRPGSRARLTGPLPPRGATLVQMAGDAAARELVELDAGLRSLVKLERATRALAEEVADDRRARGYLARVYVGPPGPGGSAPRAIAFVARDASVLEEAIRIEEGLVRPRSERAADVLSMGRLLGYPDCCVRAFADHPEQNDATWFARLSRMHEGSLLPEQNWASAELRLFSHFPCGPRCEATLAHARRSLKALFEVSPGYASMLERALRSVAIVMAVDRSVLLEEPETAGALSEAGVSYAYGRVWSPARLGMDNSHASAPEQRAFELEIVDLLAEGDRVLRTPHALSVYLGSRLLGEIVFAEDAPRLLDFRGRRVLPRLRVLGA